MNYRRNKKAIAYWYIMGFMSVLLLILFTWIRISASEASFYDPNYEILESADFQSTFKIMESQMINTYLDNELVNIKSNFFRASLLQNEIGDVDESSLNSCSLNTVPVFYNEKVIDSRGPDGTLEDNSCLILPESFVSDFSEVAREKIENDISDFYVINSFVSLDDVSAQFDDSGIVELVISTSLSDVVSYGETGSTNEYRKEINIRSYNDLIDLLSELLPQYSDIIQSDFITCTDDSELSEMDKSERDEFCYNSLFSEIFPDDSYSFEISEDSSLSNSEYIVLNFRFLDSEDKLELEFKSVFRNNVPFGVVEFELINSDKLDNVIEVELTKFVSSEATPDKYMIIYSYENFLDEFSYGTDRYNEFISMLENSEIPSGFNDAGYEVFGSKYHYSRSDTSIDLNLLSVSGTGFDSEDKKKVPIYQMYNFDTNTYELLEPDREVYVTVFAVDPPGYNYFTDRDLLELAFRNLETVSFIGPDPLQSATVIGNIAGHEQSLNIQIDNDDPEVVSYGIYVYKNGNPLSSEYGKQCDSSYCYVNVLKDVASNIILTSSFADFGSGYSSISRLNNFVIENSQAYRVRIVPEDANENGVLKMRSPPYTFTDKGNFFILETANGIIVEPYTSPTVQVIDNSLIIT